MSDDKSKNDDKAMSDEQFDQTNGLAGNLEGDDGGAEDPEGEQDRGYSEEGRD